MITVPNQIKELLHKDSHRKNIRIHFPNNERSDICNDQIVLGSVSFTESLCSQNTFKFGLCEAPIFECEVVGVGNITGAVIEVTCEVSCSATVSGAIYQLDLQEYVYPIPYGTFTISEAKRQADMNHRRIVAYGGQAAVDWNIRDFEKKKLSYGTSYTPNLGYLIAENGLNVIKNECDKTEIEIAPWTNDFTYTFLYSITKDFDLKAEFTSHSKEFRVSNGYYAYSANDYNALYQFSASKYEYINQEYLYQEISSFFEPFLDVNNAPFYSNFMRSETSLWSTGELQLEYAPEGSGPSNTRTTYDLFNYLVYPYVNGIENHQYNMLRCNMYTGVDLYIKNRNTDEILYQKTINFIDGIPKCYQYKYRQDASAWTASTISINCISEGDVVGSTPLYRPDFSNLDLQNLLDGLAETMGRFAYVSRESFTVDFINIKQRFGLTPDENLYPSGSLVPSGPTGGVLVPQDYQSCWYEDEYTKPFGLIECKYKDTNNADAEFKLYISGFSEKESSTMYKTYSLDNNSYIKYNMWTAAQIQAICETIADNIEGVAYMPFELVGRGLPYVEAGDTFEVFTPNSDSITTIVLNRTITGEQVLTDSYRSV